MSNVPSKIYAALIAQGAAASLPGSWSRHTGQGPKLIKLPDQFDRTVDDLRRTFFEEDLAATGILKKTPAGGYLLRGQEVFPIYGQLGKAPDQILGRFFCLPRTQPPHMALLDDARLQTLLQNTPMGLAIAGDLTDTAILLQLGVPAVPLDSLRDIDAQGLQAFERKVNHACGTRDKPGSTPLVLVGGSLAVDEWALELNVAAGAEHLRCLNQHLRIGPRLSLWIPQGETREALETVIRFGSTEDTKNHLLSSLERDALPIPSDEATRMCRRLLHREPAWDITSALRDWMEAHRLDRFSRQPVMRRLERARNAALVEPLLEQADQTADPIERNLLVMLSNTFRQLHDLSARLGYLLVLRDNESFERAQIPETSLSQQQMLTTQAISIYRAIESRRAAQDRAQMDD